MNNDAIATITQNETMTEFGDNGDFDDWLRLTNTPTGMDAGEHDQANNYTRPTSLNSTTNVNSAIQDTVGNLSEANGPKHDVRRTRFNRFNDEPSAERPTPRRHDESRLRRTRGGSGNSRADVPGWLPDRSSGNPNDDPSNNVRCTNTPNIRSPCPDNEKLIKTFGALFDKEFKWNGKSGNYRDFIERFEDVITQTHEILLSIMKAEIVTGSMH